MIIHLAIDDKFLNGFIANLRKIDKIENHFFIILTDNEIKYPLDSNLVNYVLSDRYNLTSNLKKKIPFKKLIIHGFTDTMRASVLQLPRTIKITTIIYGFEIYSHIGKKTKIYALETLKLKKKRKKNYRNIRDYIWIIRNELIKKKINKQSFKRIDVIAHYLENEYLIFKKHLNLNATFLDFNMGYTSDILDLKKINNIDYSPDRNILIGNSADPSNNHLDIFRKINDFQINKFDNIYCPLSYAENFEFPNYKKKICDIGSKRFKSKFRPIINQLTKIEFNKLIRSCEKIILYNFRSQGGTCVWCALYFGIDLYLSEKNPFYKYFTSKGAVIFKIENGVDLNISLDNDQKEINKKILLDNFSDEIVTQKFNNLIK
tara:strand:+ start:3350 stop:4474 length:1125 start_codon:yes stop_codon:yes gene_type:complete